MQKLLVVLLLCTVASRGYGQKSPVKFGTVPLEDLTMETYEKDPSAPAVILTDYGHAYLAINSVNAALQFERHKRIKVLSADGFSHADQQIILSKDDRITNLKATTYNLENGKVVESKMNKESIFKEKYNQYLVLHKFTLPNVREGSVIEFSYTVSSEALADFPNWQFQSSIPCRHSEYWAVVPEFFVLEKYMQGYLSSAIYEAKPRNTAGGYMETPHHWVMKDVPAFKPEPYMLNDRDFYSKINFALAYIKWPNRPIQEVMGSWDKMTDNLLEAENFGKFISGNGRLRKVVEQVVGTASEPREKIEKIYNYVKAQVAWNGGKDFLADPARDILEKREGTSGDINLLLASMLHKADIAVDMVLLSTRDHGIIRQQYPMRKQFNYVVCRVFVDNQPVFLDATEKFLAWNVLPERCLNGQGLIVSTQNRGWINLPVNAKVKTTASVDARLLPDGRLEGNIKYTRDGYDGQAVRRQVSHKGTEAYLKDFAKTKTWQVQKSEMVNVEALDKPVVEQHVFSLEEHASVAGNQIYLSPFITFQLKENPFKSETRQYPVDFGSPLEQNYMCSIIIPEGYEIDELPQPKAFALPGNAARFSYNVGTMNGKVIISSNMAVNRPLFVGDDYELIREFYAQVVAKQAEQIVFKKK